ncbi:glycosyltransferase family 1 protein [Candidatus Microgenomates bacterium]|nr:MAG: glycosyltransferase family 1 protein [Candidatus Microgenomates bacterium]
MHKPLSIIFICAEFPLNGRPTGGFGTYIDNISLGLTQLGHSVSIVCKGDKDQKTVDIGRTIYVIKPWFISAIQMLRQLKFNALNRILSYLTFPLFFSLQSRFLVQKLRKTQKIDVIEGGEFAGEMIAHSIFKPSTYPKVVIKLHTSTFIIRQFNSEAKTIFYRISKLLERIVIQNADLVHAPTKSIAKLTEKEVGRTVSKIIPYPVINKNILKIKRTDNLILYVGKLQRKKGIYSLLEAFTVVSSRLLHAKLLIVGPDTTENGISGRMQLQKIVERNHLSSSVNIKDPVSQEKLAKYYLRAAVTIVPSLWENMPFVALEAIQFGSPLIISETIDLGKVLKSHAAAVTVPPQNPEKMAQAIIKLLQNRQKRKLLASKAKQFVVSNYNLIKVGQATVQFYS